MYSRGSGPGGPATPSGPPNMSSSGSNSKPGSDYNYAGYGSYSDTYGAPPRSYGSDAGSQVGGYTSGPPNAGAKHFNDFKEWPSSWQPFDGNVIPAGKNIHLYFNAVKATIEDAPAGVTLKQLNCNGWKGVGLVRAAGLVAPAKD